MGGAIPYTPAALERRNENRENWLERDPEIKCYLPGVPRATYMPFPFQIFQSESHFFMAYEYAGAVRDVYFVDPGPPQHFAQLSRIVEQIQECAAQASCKGAPHEKIAYKSKRKPTQ